MSTFRIHVRGLVPPCPQMDAGGFFWVVVGDALRKTYTPCILDGHRFYNGCSMTSRGDMGAVFIDQQMRCMVRLVARGKI